MSQRINLTGRRFGFLTVSSYHGVDREGKAVWVCECRCGGRATVRGRDLRTGHTQSCGCRSSRARAGKLNRTHGRSRTRLYRVWANIIQRCESPGNPRWPQYGGSGVTVCDRWRHSFEAFRRDVGEPPFPRASLDRYPDRTGHYEPGNVRWATDVEQANNKNSNRRLVLGGVERTVADWARETGIKASVISTRLNVLGWSVEKALTTPTRLCRRV